MTYQQRFSDGEIIEFDTPTIVFASASPRRSRLLDSAGINYVKILSDVDDTEFNDEFPHENITHRQEKKYAAQMAITKLQPFIDNIKNGAIVTADTTALCKGRILEKPIFKEKCREQHEFISGQTTYLYTAIAVHFNGKTVCKVLCAKMKIRPLPQHIIEEICNEPETLDCAGYRIQGAIGPYCSYRKKNTNDIVSGFNIPTMKKLLKRVGFKYKL